MSEEKVVKILSAKQILEAEDIRTIEVEVPEWNGTVLIRTMTADESMAYYEALNKPGVDKRQGAVYMAAACLVDPEGKKLFTMDEVEQLSKKSFGALLRIQREALKLNGITAEAEKVAKNVSGGVGPAASPSA